MTRTPGSGGNRHGTVFCKACGKIGHNRRTCAVARELQANAARAVIADRQQADRQATQRDSEKAKVIAEVNAMGDGYQKIFAAIADPPRSPLKLNKWAQQIVALCLRETAQGRGCFPLNAEIVKLTTAIVRLTPKDVIYEAQRLLKGDAMGNRSKARERQLDAPVPGSTPIR
jgi:hypothetical protein